MDNKIVVWQMRPVWGLANPSPFCMKLETWLRMANLPYEAKEVQLAPKSKTGKMPYIEYGGKIVHDSTVIIDRLSKEYGVNLDQKLSEKERAEACFIQRTFEESLYFLIAHERWESSGWQETKRAYFGHAPAAIRATVPYILRRQIMRDLWGQGSARLSRDERAAHVQRDYQALSDFLGDKPYFFREPSTVDATAYAFVANALHPPYDGPAHALARQFPNLVAYDQRMRARYFADHRSAS